MWCDDYDRIYNNLNRLNYYNHKVHNNNDSRYNYIHNLYNIFIDNININNTKILLA